MKCYNVVYETAGVRHSSIMRARTMGAVQRYYASQGCIPIKIELADNSLIVDARSTLYQVTARYLKNYGSYSRICLIHATTAKDALREGTRHLSINNTDNAVYSVLALKT